MANTIKLKRGSGSNPGTSDLSVGEVALRTDNGTLFTKNDAGNITEIGASSGVSDGDKGDLTVSNSGATWLIDSGVIDNANINASAAIAGTKISPDFGSQNITTTGELRLTGTFPNIKLFDSNNNDDYEVRNDNGTFSVRNSTDAANVFQIAGDNTTTVAGNLDVGAGVDVTGNITVSGTVDGVDIAARNTLFGGLTSSSGVLSNGVTATTQSANDNSTKVATTAYTDTAISNLVDSSPSALNTLNELAAALNDDANFSTTVTNSIATKLPLAGGTLTGDVSFSNGSKLTIPTSSTTDYVLRLSDSGVASYDWTFPDASTIQLATNTTSTKTLNVTNAGSGSFGITAEGTITAALFSGSGASLTSLNASNISSGTIAAARVATLNQDTTGTAALATSVTVTANNGNNENVYLAFVDSSAGGTQGIETDGALNYNPSTNVLTAGEFFGSGPNLTSLNANNLSSGTVSTARLGNSGTRSSSSYFRGDNTWADDGCFVRSDASDSLSGNTYNFSGTDGEKIILSGTSSPFIRFQESTTNKAYIGWHEGGYIRLQNDEDDSILKIQDDIVFSMDDGSNFHKVWHAGNDGSGSNLDADTLDGVQGASYLRSDVSDTFSGANLTLSHGNNSYPLTIDGGDSAKILLSGADNPYIRWREDSTDKAYIQWHNSGYIYIANEEQSRQVRIGGTNAPEFYDGSSWHIQWTQGNDGSGSALDADTVDGIEASAFLRSDTSDTQSGGITFSGSNSHVAWVVQSSSATVWQSDTTKSVSFDARSDGGSGAMLHKWNKTQLSGGTYQPYQEAWYDGDSYHYLKVASNTFKFDNNTIWHVGSDGSGSGLDADTVDGFGTSQSGGANNIAVFGSDGYLYVDDWIRVGNNDGIYCANGQHLFAGGDSSYVSWINRSDSATACGIGMQSSNGTTRGYSYADETMVGLLNGSGSWVFRVTNGNSSNGLQTGGGYLVWHQQNDGSGSGLDADTLDGYDSLNFIGTRGNSYYSPTTWIDWGSTQAGLYWSGGDFAGVHFYPENNRFLINRSGHANQTGLALYTQGTRRGYLYANSSNEIGLLDKDENWILRGTDDQRTVFYGEINIGGNQSSNPFSKLEFGATQYGSCSIAPADDGSHKVGMNFYVDGSANTAINADFAGKITCYGEWRLKSGTNSDAAQSTDPVHCIGNPNTDGNTSNFARLVMQERTSHWISFKTGGGEHYGSIYKSGNNVVYGGTSDYRYKENVAPITDGITTLKRLRPVTYNWNEFSKFENTDTHRGFIAHEVQEVEPDAVSGTKDGMTYSGNCVNAAGETTQVNVQESQKKDGETWTKTHEAIDIQQLDERKLVPILTAALQEAVSKIEVLETKVAALEAA